MLFRSTRFHLGTPITRGTIAVLPSDPSLANNVEFRTYQQVVETELRNIGFGPVGSLMNPEFTATMVYGQRLQASNQPQSQTTIGFGFGSFGSNVGAGANVAVPVGGRRGPNLVAVNELALQIKRSQTMSPIWEGRATASGPSDSPTSSLQATIQPLSRALLSEFPGPSGTTTRVPR